MTNEERATRLRTRTTQQRQQQRESTGCGRGQAAKAQRVLHRCASGHLSLEGAVRSMGVAVAAVATLCRRLVDARGRGHGGGSGGRVEGRDGGRG